jgi:hypothetical protein
MQLSADEWITAAMDGVDPAVGLDIPPYRGELFFQGFRVQPGIAREYFHRRERELLKNAPPRQATAGFLGRKRGAAVRTH